MTDHEYKWLRVRPGFDHPIGLRLTSAEHYLTLEQWQEIVGELMQAISHVAAVVAAKTDDALDVSADSPPGSCFVASGFPMPGERVVVTRKSGKQFIARLACKPDAFWRDRHNMHWLTEDDKFADVGSDPIVSWSR